MKNTSYMIIGQGLAGTLLAYFLLKKGRQVMVIDEEKAITPSKIAAGMFTPISGKRMAKSKTVDAALFLALQTYRELETYLDVKILHEQDIYQVFGSVKEQNDLGLKAEDAHFSSHIDLHPARLPNLMQPFGAFGVTGSGWVDTKLLLQKFKEKLSGAGQFLSEKFDHALLKHENGKWHYKNMAAEYVVFCEGAYAQHNPFFTNLPFELCRGDILTIECKGISKAHIIKKGVYMIHLYDDVYKAGSTYDWYDLREEPTEAGLQVMTKKLAGLLEVPFTVLSHQAAIRPTTHTREPVLLQHSSYPNMHLLNGLGTKGVLNGPQTASQLIAKLEE